MTKEEREIALHCLKVSSDYHSEVCEECVKYHNCDYMIQDDVTETIIKALEQEPCEDAISREGLREPRFIITENDYQKGWNDALDAIYENAPSVRPKTGQQS